jgi:YVTN family beta-propeller protein
MNDTTVTGRGGDNGISVGATFAGHRIEAEIGRGGMGVVYRARHLALDRERALKLITPSLSADRGFRERFQRESRLAASIEHPNVILVHHAGEEDGLLYLSMRLVDGTDLRRIVQAEGPLPPPRVAELITGVAAGLDAAHARGLVHRDVKPANVLVERGDDGERVFLTDFGISRIAGGGGTLTASGDLLGSVDYVAPEQIDGERGDHRVDVYALGCVLHFALAGDPPFLRDNDLAKLYAHAHAPRPRPSESVPGLPPALDEVVATAMAIHPDDRYASAGQLAAEVARIAAGTGPTTQVRPAAMPSFDQEPTRRIRRLGGGSHRPAAILAVVIAVAAAVAATILVLVGTDDGGPTTAKVAAQPKPVDTIAVEKGPVALSVGDINLWVASKSTHAVNRIDPGTDRPAGAPIAVAGQPVAVAVGFGSIWVADTTSNSVLRLDPSQSPTPVQIPVGEHPSDVAVGGGWVWVTNQRGDSVSRVDPSTNRTDRTIPVGAGPRSVATGAGAVWVANIDGKSVTEIDPRPGRVVGKPVGLGQRPNDLAVGDGYIWVADVFNGTVTRVDPRSLKIVGDPIEVGARPRGVNVGLGYVWVANGGDGTVTRIDPKSAAPAGPPIRVGKNPADIAVGKGAVWTANFDDSTVTKIRP